MMICRLLQGEGVEISLPPLRRYALGFADKDRASHTEQKPNTTRTPFHAAQAVSVEYPR